MAGDFESNSPASKSNTQKNVGYRDTFGTFLETMNAASAASSAGLVDSGNGDTVTYTAPRDAASADRSVSGSGTGISGTQSSNLDSSLILLSYLARPGRASMLELMGTSKMRFLTFTEAIKALVDADLITVSGDEGNEVVELTSKGQSLAQ